jgi:hypothetical protein
MKDPEGGLLGTFIDLPRIGLHPECGVEKTSSKRSEEVA